MQATAAEWYYIGHYGQLGPLTLDQMEELISGGVIAKDTYVWRSGMTDWVPADRMGELRPSFMSVDPMLVPPPTPPARTSSNLPNTAGMGSWRTDALATPTHNYPAYGAIRSDRSRVLGGVLNLIFPGVGRMYLGHFAHGVLQFVLMFCGIGAIWSFVDGIIILSGGVKYDGYGRVLAD